MPPVFSVRPYLVFSVLGLATVFTEFAVDPSALKDAGTSVVLFATFVVFLGYLRSHWVHVGKNLRRLTVVIMRFHNAMMAGGPVYREREIAEIEAEDKNAGGTSDFQ